MADSPTGAEKDPRETPEAGDPATPAAAKKSSPAKKATPATKAAAKKATPAPEAAPDEEPVPADEAAPDEEPAEYLGEYSSPADRLAADIADDIALSQDAAEIALQQASLDAREAAEFEEAVADRLARGTGEASWPKRIAAEFIGTFILVLFGVGVAMWMAQTGTTGFQVALAFGIAVVVAALAFGHISGGHFNPAVTLGAALAGRTRWLNVPVYWVSQVLGGLAASGLLWVVWKSVVPNTASAAAQSQIANGATEASLTEAIKTNVIDVVWSGVSNSTQAGVYTKVSIVGAILIEAILTMVFVIVVLAATARSANRKLAPFAIGLALAMLLAVAIPFTNGSLNPARSTATAFFTGGIAIKELWIFWVAPLLGGALGGLLYPLLGGFGSGTADELDDVASDVAYDIAVNDIEEGQDVVTLAHEVERR